MEPDSFDSGVDGCNILGLSGQEGNDALQLAGPADSTRSNLDEVATGRLSTVRVVSDVIYVICISPSLKEGSTFHWGICELQVFGALKVAEKMLHCSPMGWTWVAVVVGEATDGILDV